MTDAITITNARTYVDAAGVMRLLPIGEDPPTGVALIVLSRARATVDAGGAVRLLTDTSEITQMTFTVPAAAGLRLAALVGAALAMAEDGPDMWMHIVASGDRHDGE